MDVYEGKVYYIIYKYNAETLQRERINSNRYEDRDLCLLDAVRDSLKTKTPLDNYFLNEFDEALNTVTQVPATELKFSFK